jgi:hypothetical protein
MGDNIIKLELTQNEVNQILFALSEMPYKQVFELIGKIQNQGNLYKKTRWMLAFIRGFLYKFLWRESDSEKIFDFRAWF